MVPTFGGYSQFPPAQQQDLLAGIGAAIDAVGGSFRMGYIAIVATAARSDTHAPGLARAGHQGRRQRWQRSS